MGVAVAASPSSGVPATRDTAMRCHSSDDGSTESMALRHCLQVALMVHSEGMSARALMAQTTSSESSSVEQRLARRDVMQLMAPSRVFCSRLCWTSIPLERVLVGT